MAPTKDPAQASEPAPNPPADSGWSRGKWLEMVDGYIADPKSMPRLADPATRAEFLKLVTTRAWLDADPAMFEGDNPDVGRFFPAIKGLNVAILEGEAFDELLALNLFVVEVYGAIVRTARATLERVPEGDPTRASRQQGFDQLQLGAALAICGILYTTLDAEGEWLDVVVARLTQPSTYEPYGAEELQLVLVTLDENVLAVAPATLRPRYQRIRAVVAAEHATRSSNPSQRVTYQAVGRIGEDPHASVTIVSTTGGFSVMLGPAAVAKRVDYLQPDGQVVSQHWIGIQLGPSRLDAACFDGHTETSVAALFLSMGLTATSSPHPGTWLSGGRSGSVIRMRILGIGDRGCFAAAEGPSGDISTADLEAFLLSLRAAP